MGRARHIIHLTVITGTLILVAHQQADRGAKRFAIFNPGEDGHLVCFFPGCGEITLPGTPPIKLRLDISFRQLKAGRATINNRADTDTVRFTKSANAKQSTERTGHQLNSQNNFRNISTVKSIINNSALQGSP